MKENKKYYWLKLKEDFFDDKYIKALRKLPDGEALVIVYLKMQLKSLKTEGFIQYDHILPSAEEELALVLDEDVNIVRLTLNAIVNMGLVERWENDTLYMVAMQNLIGSETAAAERVRKHRQKQKMLAPPKSEAKTNAERQKAFRAKKACEEKQHIPFIEDHMNLKRYGGNYYIVMKRDKFKCSICGSIENLCVHHIDGYDEFKPQNNNENKLLTMCRSCHRQAHEGAEIPKDILESIDYFEENNGSNDFCNTEVTKCNTYIEIEKREKTKEIEQDIEIEQDNNIIISKENDCVSKSRLEEEFNIIWSDYPNKKGKANALKSYIKARKKGITKEDIYNGLQDYIKYIKLEKIDQQYIKHGSTWFAQECWNDDYTIKREMTTGDVAEYMDFSEFR